MDLGIQKLGANSQMNYVGKENGVKAKEKAGNIPVSYSDSVELSGKVTKKKPATREEAVAIMEKIQEGLSSPEEGKVVYMPYVIDKERRKTWLGRKLFGETKKVKSDRSLLESINLLDKGESIYFKPMKWTRWTYTYWDGDEKIDFHLVSTERDSTRDSTTTKVSNFNELRDFYELEMGGKLEDLKPEPVSSMPEPKEIIKEFAKLFEEPPEVGKIIHVPYELGKKRKLKGTYKLKPTSFTDAYLKLKKGEDVYMLPHVWTNWDYNYTYGWHKSRFHLVALGESGAGWGNRVDTALLSSLKDLQEYHKIWR